MPSKKSCNNLISATANGYPNIQNLQSVCRFGILKCSDDCLYFEPQEIQSED